MKEKSLPTLEMTSEKDRIHTKDTNNLEKVEKEQNPQTLPFIGCSHSASDAQHNSTRARPAVLTFPVRIPSTREYINGHNHSQESKIRRNVFSFFFF